MSYSEPTRETSADDGEADARQVDVQLRRVLFDFDSSDEAHYQPLAQAWMAGDTAPASAVIAGLARPAVFDALVEELTMPSMTEPEATREQLEHFLGEAVRGTPR